MKEVIEQLKSGTVVEWRHLGDSSEPLIGGQEYACTVLGFDCDDVEGCQSFAVLEGDSMRENEELAAAICQRVNRRLASPLVKHSSQVTPGLWFLRAPRDEDWGVTEVMMLPDGSGDMFYRVLGGDWDSLPVDEWGWKWIRIEAPR